MRDEGKQGRAPSRPIPSLTPHPSSFLVVVGLAVWVSLLSVPRHVETPDLGPSWEQALAYFFKHGFQTGKDYVFSYGPLGYFFTYEYDGDLYWWKYAWELAVNALLAGVLVGVGWRLPDRASRVLYLVLVLAFVSAEQVDALYAAGLLGLGLYVIGAGRWTWPAAAAVLGLAVLALVKFTFLILAGGYVLIAVGALALRRRWGGAAAVLGTFAAGVLAAWLAAGQSPANIPAYLRGSFEIARGYGPAMSIPGSAAELKLALVIAVVVGALAVALRPAASDRARWWAVALASAVGLFLEWKQGFTRHDAHSGAFFAYAMLVPFFGWAALPAAGPRLVGARVLTWTAAVLSVVGIHAALATALDPLSLATGWWARVARNGRYVIRPDVERARLEAAAARPAEQWLLPHFRALIGDAPADLFTIRQGVLFRNGLLYRPRPVFQSYSAYTPYLQRLNADFLEGSDAPEYLVVSWDVPDGRLPAGEDATALLVLLRRYVPVAQEKGWLLLRREPDGRQAPARTLLDRTVRFDEPVSLAGFAETYQTLALHVEYSAWGRLRALLYKPPPVGIVLETADGQPLAFRVVPGAVEGGVLLNPLLETNQDLLNIYGLSPPRRVRSFHVVVAEADRASYADAIRVVIEARPGLVRRPARRGEVEGTD